MARSIPIPEPVMVISGEPWTFQHSVALVISRHPSFNSNGSGIRAGGRVEQAIAGKVPGDRAELDKVHGDGDWEMIHAAMENPVDGKYCPDGLEVSRPDGTKEKIIVPGRTFLPYIDAVSDEATKG